MARSCNMLKIIKFTLKIIFKYFVALALLHLYLNRKRFVENLQKANEFMENVSDDKSISSIQNYFYFCEDDLLDYFVKTRTERRKFLNDIKQYAVIIFLSLHYKDAVLNQCLEKIYTLSFETHNTTFNELKEKFSSTIDGEYFDKLYMKAYSKLTRTETEPSATVVKNILETMLETVETTNFKALKELKEKIPASAEKLIKKLFITDTAFVKYGFEDEDIIKSKAVQENKDLQELFSKVVEKIENATDPK